MESDATNFTCLLKECIHSNILLPVYNEARFAVFPLVSPETDSRLVIHQLSDPDRDVAIYNINIASQCPYTTIVTNAANYSNIKDIIKTLNRIEETQVFYDLTNVNEMDLSIVDKYIKNIDIITQSKILKMCCFFEATAVQKALIVNIMSKTLERRYITGGVVSSPLDLLAEAADIELGPLDEFMRLNSFGVSMRYIDRRTMIQLSKQLEINELDSDINSMFLSATQQVHMLYNHVIHGKMNVVQFIEYYNREVISNKVMVEETKILNMMMLNSVVNRIAHILHYLESTLNQVPVFNYTAWHIKNLSKIVDKRKETYCIVTQ